MKRSGESATDASLPALSERIVACRLCPRLVAFREWAAVAKRASFRDWQYWGRPLPGFGDPRARVVIVGLAPAAHGGNRTGRMFTGDRSGDWLFRSMHRAGFANQATSVSRDDGLELRDCYITAAVRCAPPGNRPTTAEFARCRPYLVRELELLDRAKVVVALGGAAHLAFLRAWKVLGRIAPIPAPRFRHGACVRIPPVTLLDSYHPSQRNTSTGRLTEPMFDAIFRETRSLLDRPTA